jgi:autotransporter-associated beta strand protein
VATPAAASPSPATGTTVALSVLGADDAGASTLTYTWTATATPPAPVTFSANGTNAAHNTTAQFTTAGTYNFLVTITDAAGLTAASSVSVTVDQTLTSISSSGQPPVVTAFDQFGVPLADQPAFDAGSDTISAAVALANNVTVLPAAGSKLTITGGISGVGSLTIDAPATVVLKGPNSYTGGTVVSAGTLIVAASSALAANTNLTVGASAAFLLSPSGGGAESEGSLSVDLPSPSGRGAGGEGSLSVDLPSPSASVAGGEGSLSVDLPSPSASVAGGEGSSSVDLPSPSGRGAGGEGGLLVQLPSPSASVAGGEGSLSVDLPSPSGRGAGGEGGPIWPGQVAAMSKMMGPHQNKAAILAVDAVFAQYGR